MSRWIIPIAVLPGTVLVLVPALIAWATRDGPQAAEFAGFDSVLFWLAVLSGLPSAALSIWSMTMFFRFGEGTAAPWDPPRRLVVAGPYRHVRNPMLTGVFGLLIAETLSLQSWPLAAWTAVVIAGNAIYFPLVEEPKLLARFGEDYRQYCRHVRRWLPRLRPWSQPAE